MSAISFFFFFLSSNTSSIDVPAIVAIFFFSGCYDGHVYCFNLKTGDIVWSYRTRDLIKCTAILSKSKDKLYVGSYDKNAYCLSTEVCAVIVYN